MTPPCAILFVKMKGELLMKLFIGSDIHGSSANIRRFLDIVADARKDSPAKMLNDSKDFIRVIKGNCDSEVDQMISEFPIESDFSLDWQGRTVFFTHGHKCNPDLPPKDAKDGDIVFYGHFHRAMLQVKDGVIYVCVGAIGLSPEGVERSYCVLDEHSITIKTLEGGKELVKYDI